MRDMKSKKGDISLQIVILAVIGLVVLAVLLYIFLGRAGILDKTTGGGTCTERGGVCLESITDSCPDATPLKNIGVKCKEGDTNCGATKTCACCLPMSA